MSESSSRIPKTFDEQEGESVCATYDSLIDLIVMNSGGYDFEIPVSKGKYKIVSGLKLLSSKLFKATWQEALHMHAAARITPLAEIEIWCYTTQAWLVQDIGLILKS